MRKVLYAMTSGHIGGRDGLMVYVRKGTHWLSTDPLVQDHPSVFSPDPRWGLCSTVPFESIPEDVPDPGPAVLVNAMNRRR